MPTVLKRSAVERMRGEAMKPERVILAVECIAFDAHMGPGSGKLIERICQSHLPFEDGYTGRVRRHNEASIPGRVSVQGGIIKPRMA